MKKDTNKSKTELLAELDNLRKKSKEQLEKLSTANQQLNANNQQLQATEQQLRAANQQLEANNQQLQATEQALLKSEEKFRLAFQNSPDSINITRLSDGKLIEANNSFEKITGHKVSDSLGKKTTDLNLWANPGDREQMKEELSRGEKIENFEFIRNMKNGHEAFSVMSAAIFTINKEPHLLSVIRDTDDLKKAEIRLQDSKARLNEAELIAKMGHFTWDIKSGDVNWSEGLHILLGYDNTEKIDYNKVNAEIHHPDDLERITTWLNECIASGKTNFPPNEYRLLQKNGKVIHVKTTIKVLHKENMSIKMFGTVQDITEHKKTQEAYKEAQSNLQAILDNRKDSIWSLDLNYNYLVYNKPYADVISSNMGIRLEKGMNALEIHPKEVNDYWKPKFDEVFKGKYVTFEFSHILDGKEHFFEVFMNPIYTDNKVSGLSALSMDITNRKEIQLQNQTIQKRLEEAEIVGQSGNWSHETATGEIIWSDGMYRIYGIDPQKDTINNEKLLGLIHSDDRTTYNAYFEKMLGLKPGYTMEDLEYRILRPGGALRWVTVKFETEFDKDDKPAKFFGTLLDITDRKQAEEALIKSRNRYQSLFDYSPEPLWEEDFSEVKKFIDHLKQDNIKDFKDFFKDHPDKVLACSQMIKITDVNNAVLKLHEAKYKEDLLKGLASIFTEESYKAFTQELIAIADEKSIHEFEGTVKTLKGKVKDVYIKWMIVPGYEDTLEKVYLSTTDITKRKQNEKEKQDLQEQLNHKSKMDAIGELAGGMAHDFNNVLNGIMSAAELLQLPKQGLNEKSLKYVDLIIQSSRRASDLISKLLTFGHKGHIARSTFNIHKVLNETVDILKETIDRKITISLTEEAYNQYLIGDISAMESAFLNLGINASHAMPDGGEIRINTKNMFLDQMFCDSSSFEITPGDFIQIVIKDSGCGITEENLQKIFDPFFTTKGQGKGTGLGLSAVYGTIQNHHGAIEVHSSVGIGTTFYILLPCSGESAHQIEEKDQPVKGAGTILLVDDEEFNRILNGEILETLGYQIILAEDGQEAVEIFKEKHTEIDIVLMDMIMPEMNGSEAFYKMKEIDKNCHVIIASGYTKDERIEELLGNGVKGFIRKPYKISEISQVLDKVYKEQR